MHCKCIPWFKIYHQLYTLGTPNASAAATYVHWDYSTLAAVNTEWMLHSKLWKFESQITVSLRALVYLKCSLHLILEGLNRLKNWPEGEHHHREEQFVLQLLRSQPNNGRSNHSARSHQQYQSRDTVLLKSNLFVEGSHHGRWNFKDTNP